MPLPLVIVNPESAGGWTRAAWPRIASDLRSHFGPFAIAFTEQPGQAVELASDAARKGTKFIIACGGDGTISEVANGILQSATTAELGILPSGTGGDFRRTLEISTRTRDAADILRNGQTRLIDVGRVTYINPAGVEDTMYFLGVASFGMSAAVIERVKESGPEWLPAKAPKWLTGRLSFGASMLQTAMQSPATKVVVHLDDEHERHLTVANFCVALARYFGGGMKIAPDAKLTDGLFDVVCIGDMGARKIITNAPRVYLGSHLSLDQVHHTLAKKIGVRTAAKDEVIALEIDGELPGHLPATFQILPAALRVRCPA
ncbi:MAG: diacylglycerol kinase family lipid kinase [Acidobacteriota bacterium]|nr:diacylglycerol kinase family lipid kinase [Acidobacteriota bacterium]